MFNFIIINFPFKWKFTIFDFFEHYLFGIGLFLIVGIIYEANNIIILEHEPYAFLDTSYITLKIETTGLHTLIFLYKQ